MLFTARDVFQIERDSVPFWNAWSIRDLKADDWQYSQYSVYDIIDCVFELCGANVIVASPAVEKITKSVC